MHNFVTGNKPAPGNYVCDRCHEQLRLKNSGDKLPPCPKCHYVKFVNHG